MRDLFPGYYRPTDEEFSSLWNEAFFYFDANVLLNLYRYSADTSRTFIKLLGSDVLKYRIRLPYRAAEEYHKHRIAVIVEQRNMYQELRLLIEESVNKICNTIKERVGRHYIIDSKSIIERITSIKNEIHKELENSEGLHPDLFGADTILEQITELFDKRVSNCLSKEKLDSLLKEGSQRYADKIPPGYEDHKKDGVDRFGDLILWTQIIEDAKEHKHPVIFVTDDSKEDWWYKVRERTIGPRPELVKEFKEKANVRFYLYNSHHFTLYGQKFLKLSADAAALIEIKHVQKINDAIARETEEDIKEGAHMPLKEIDNSQSIQAALRLFMMLRGVRGDGLGSNALNSQTDRIVDYLRKNNLSSFARNAQVDRTVDYLRKNDLGSLARNAQTNRMADSLIYSQRTAPRLLRDLADALIHEALLDKQEARDDHEAQLQAEQEARDDHEAQLQAEQEARDDSEAQLQAEQEARDDSEAQERRSK